MRLDGRLGRLQTVKTQHGRVFMPTGHGAKTGPRHNCEFMTACLRLFTEAWVCRGNREGGRRLQQGQGLGGLNEATCIICCTALRDVLG